MSNLNVCEMKIGKTVFEWRNHSYRLTGFYFAYFSKEGRLMEYIKCPRSEANAASGTGVSGCIVLLSEIEVLERTVSGFDYEECSYLEGLEDLSNHAAIEILKSYKPNMTSKGFKISRTRKENKRFNLWLDDLLSYQINKQNNA